MAAEKMGRETVTYVSNIYKYYLAYQLIEEERAERERTRRRSSKVIDFMGHRKAAPRLPKPSG